MECVMLKKSTKWFMRYINMKINIFDFPHVSIIFSKHLEGSKTNDQY